LVDLRLIGVCAQEIPEINSIRKTIWRVWLYKNWEINMVNSRIKKTQHTLSMLGEV
jgi:hypothetical protein